MTLTSKNNETTGPPHRLSVQGKTPFNVNGTEIVDGIEPEAIGELILFFINENDLSCCPQVNISFGNGISASALLDTGSEANILTEKLYDQLIGAGIDVPTLPLENVALVTAFGRRTKRIKKQALIQFFVGEDRFEAIFLICPQLINSAILGSSFAKEYGISIDFVTKCFYYKRDGSRKGHSFDQSSGPSGARNDEQESKRGPPQKCFCVTHDLKTPTVDNDQLHSAVQPSCDPTQTGAGRKGKRCLAEEESCFELCYCEWWLCRAEDPVKWCCKRPSVICREISV